MKNIFKSIMLFALIGLSAQAYSQVILNGGSFEPIFLTGLYSSPYQVPGGKTLIITHLDYQAFYVDGIYINLGVGSSNTGYVTCNVHIPVGEYKIISAVSDAPPAAAEIFGYLIDNDEWGATSDVPDEEIIDNDGGGIEIYPNPTDDLASVFVDYPGDWKMTVYDINGQIVLETQSETPVKSINTNALSAGTYIVSVRAKRKLIGSSQLIVQ